MLNKTILIPALVLITTFSACVPAKKYDDLKGDFEDLQADNETLDHDLDKTRDQLDEKSDQLRQLKKDHETLVADKDDLEQNYNQLQKKYDNLKDSYDALEEESSSALAENSQQNRELLSKIEDKQKKLDAEKSHLESLKSDLEEREKHIEDLENEIASKEEQMRELKDKVSDALTDFEGKGLSVHRKNGKVYVSMENKLLFDSASWSVNDKGRQAVKKLGEVLADNPDIHVLIEGHTDNARYHGSGHLEDNWDLSAKRATAIVRILMENQDVAPENLTAAGRSKYAPVADNDTESGMAKNRRIEVILSPEWEKLSELIKDKKD